MEVRYQANVDHVGEVELLCRLLTLVNGLARGVVATIKETEIWEFLLIYHVNAAVEHNSATTNFRNNAAAPNILTSPERHNFNRH